MPHGLLRGECPCIAASLAIRLEHLVLGRYTSGQPAGLSCTDMQASHRRAALTSITKASDGRGGAPWGGQVGEICKGVAQGRELPVEHCDHMGIGRMQDQIAEPEVAMHDGTWLSRLDRGLELLEHVERTAKA
eukprot:scaffold77596_cov36-Tisochrysis_lutea.AAC.3